MEVVGDWGSSGVAGIGCCRLLARFLFEKVGLRKFGSSTPKDLLRRAPCCSEGGCPEQEREEPC